MGNRQQTGLVFVFQLNVRAPPPYLFPTFSLQYSKNLFCIHTNFTYILDVYTTNAAAKQIQHTRKVPITWNLAKYHED